MITQLAQLIDSVKAANSWSVPDLVRHAERSGHTLAKSNISRYRNEEPLISIKGAVIASIAASLHASIAQVSVAAAESMGITLPSYDVPTVEQAIRLDTGLAARDRQIPLATLSGLRTDGAPNAPADHHAPVLDHPTPAAGTPSSEDEKTPLTQSVATDAVTHKLDSPEGRRNTAFVPDWDDLADTCGVLQSIDCTFYDISLEFDEGERTPEDDVAVDAFRCVERAAASVSFAPQLTAIANREMTVDDYHGVQTVESSGAQRIETTLVQAQDSYATAFGEKAPVESRVEAALTQSLSALRSRKLAVVGAPEKSTPASDPSQSDYDLVAHTRDPQFQPQDPDAYDNTIGEAPAPEGPEVGA